MTCAVYYQQAFQGNNFHGLRLICENFPLYDGSLI